MAHNLTHVRAAYDKLKDVADSARAAIEDKETEGEFDSDRISAYETFLDELEALFDQLVDELESAK